MASGECYFLADTLWRLITLFHSLKRGRAGRREWFGGAATARDLAYSWDEMVTNSDRMW